MSTTLDARLTLTARALARLWANGDLTPDQLRQQMRDALARAHTVAMLAGTGGQRSPAIDRALRAIIEAEWAELDKLLALLASQPETDIERRLLAFADALDETRADGEQLVSGDDLSPLIPAAIGGGLAALIARLLRTPGREIMPRIDSRALSALYQTFTVRLDMLSDDLASGALTPDDWHAAMQRELRVIHSAYAQVGGGSLNEQRIQAQLDFLRQWYEGLDPDNLDAAAIRRRARMYLDAAKSSLQEGAAQAMGLRLPCYPGELSECQVNCKCSWAIQTVENGFDAYWRLRPAEHCPQCQQRAITWNPLRIRNGVIQPYNPTGLFV